MDDGWPRSPAYTLGTIAMWALFLLVIYILDWSSERDRLPAAAIGGLALFLAVSVAGQFIAAYRLVARQDEYIRGITAKRIIAATGVTITIAVLYGVSQQFLGAPNLPMWLVYPFFWGAFGFVTPFVRASRP